MTDLQEPSPAGGRIVTFYSFKGGTGRTMALANVAWILAANGKRVLVVDWDLEAPGLHRFFQPFLRANIDEVPGVIDLIREYQMGADQRVQVDRQGSPRPLSEQPELLEHIRTSVRLDGRLVSIDWRFPREGRLDFLSAGLQNDYYAAALSALDWDTFYQELHGQRFFEELRREMKRRYDYVLIDSRTGLSDVASICTIELPDVLVDCFALSSQAIEGGAKVANSIQRVYRSRRVQVLPVPMRIDQAAEKERVEAGLALAMRWFDGLPTGMNEQRRREYWAAVTVPYQAFYAFEETLAVFGDRPGSPAGLLASFERLTGYVTDGAVTSLPPMNENVRAQTLWRFTRRRSTPVDEVVLDHVPEDRLWADWITATLTGAGLVVRDAVRSEIALREGAYAAGDLDDLQVATEPGAAPYPARDPDVEPDAYSAKVSRTLVIVSPAYTEVSGGSAVDGEILAVRVSSVDTSSRFTAAASTTLAGVKEHEARARLFRLLEIPDLAPGDAASPADVRYPGYEPKIFEVPDRYPEFTGREDDLRRLRDELESGGRTVVLPRVTLHGFGGVGKTEVALEYAHRYKNDYDIVWWIDCEHPELIDAEIIELGWRISKVFSTGPTPGATGAEVAHVVVRLLSERPDLARWLLIFDNADDINAVAGFLPRGNGHVLITSRDEAWERQSARSLQIDFFDRAESIAHLQKCVSWLGDTDADRIAAALRDYPSEIAPAGAYLEETGVSVDDYLAMLGRRGPRRLPLGADGAEQAVPGVWDLSLDRLRERSPAAYWLIEMCSLLATSISTELFKNAAMTEVLTRFDPLFSHELIDRLIREMDRLALIRLDQSNIDDRREKQIRIHRLVQAVVRARMAEEGKDTEAAARLDVHRVLAAARPPGEVDDPANWQRYGAIWPHLALCGAMTSQQEAVRRLLLDRVRYIWLRADFERGLQRAEEIERTWGAMLQAEAADAALERQLLHLRFLKANVLRSLGRFDESKRLDEAVLERQLELLGEEHPHTLMTAGGIGADLRALGAFDQALERDKKTRGRWVACFGEDNERTLSASNNLALSYRLTGSIEEALRLDEDTLTRRRHVIGKGHPLTLGSEMAVCRDLIEAGRYAAAAERLQRIHARTSATLGADSIEALTTRTLFGVALRGAGRLDESELHLRKAVEETEYRLGSDSGSARACRLSYGITLMALGRAEDGMAGFQGALAGYRNSLGPEHPNALICEVNLAAVLRDTGDLAGGLRHARAALEGLTTTLGAEHPYTMAAAMVTAVLLADVGDRRESRRLDEATAGRLATTLWPDHPDTLRCQANLLLTRMQDGEQDMAAEHRLVADRLARRLGDDHYTVVTVREERRLLRAVDPQPY